MKALRDQLREWKKQSNQTKKKNKKRKKEKLSTRDIEDLMGFVDRVMNVDMEH
ncbi:hypothetical protein [Bacillus cereus]|uniref:hypothetical protein n=1 Tax=Bacillus cereus TaxID=1396 RepID=UPI002366A36D|nr:hypothetical protein [Bacillus cereus]MDD8003256.1 hypothetical protein [Bacillus cereus]